MRCALLLAGLLLAGCEAQQEPGESASVPTGRFTASYQGMFTCGQHDRESFRAIYIITDTKTGIQYMAVQGCGTSQLVTESDGKHSHQVER